jgi:hypothetical protein
MIIKPSFYVQYNSRNQNYKNHMLMKSFFFNTQARDNIENGNIHAIIDKSLEPTYNIQSVWKITEVALLCVKQRGLERPSISEVLKEIQEAILIEQKASTSRVESIDIFARNSQGSSSQFDIPNSALYTESFLQPTLR